MDIYKICQKCIGTGYAPDGLVTSICNECGGIGRCDEGEITNGIKTLNERLTDLEDKLDSIIAEQVAQRIDLTAALTQIWNKVKDL